MSNLPFFSIIIPTRNRSSLLLKSVMSAHSQTFSSREIIIVDNSDEDEASKNLEICRKVPGVKYLRTGGLSMADNWERAFSEASGEYVCLLSDRLFWPSTTFLSRLKNIIEMTDAPVISWKWCHDPSINPNIPHRTGLMGLYLSKDILESFRNMDWTTFTYMSPRCLNSAIRNSAVRKIKEKIGRFCYALSPDYTAAYSTLIHTDKIVHLDSNEVYSGGLELSNGKANTENYSSSENFFNLHSISIDDFFQELPFKRPTVRNTLVADYFKILKKWDINERFTNLNINGYFNWVIADIKQLSYTPEIYQLVEEYNKSAVAYEAPLINIPLPRER